MIIHINIDVLGVDKDVAEKAILKFIRKLSHKSSKKIDCNFEIITNQESKKVKTLTKK